MTVNARARANSPMSEQSLSADRLYSAEAAGLLERFDAAALMADGKVNLIGLDPIAERLGQRWPTKQEQVYDHVERTLGRHLGGHAVFMRVSDTSYLVAQPDASKFGAQASCFRYLRELLTYFLGDHRGATLQVLQVTRFSRAGVSVQPVDMLEAEQGEARERAHRSTTTRRIEEWSPFAASNGSVVRVSCRLERVIELKSFSCIGFRTVRDVLDEPTKEPLSTGETERLSRADLARIDLATISGGVDLVESEAQRAKPQTLIVPVSYVSLSNQRSRTALVNYLKDAQACVQRGVICEIIDVDGVPEGGLLDALSLIRPFCLFAIGRRNSPFRGQATSGTVRLRGASIECPPGLTDDGPFVSWARTAIGGLKRCSKTVMVFGASSSRQMAIAGRLGATHASLRSCARRATYLTL